MQWVMGAARLAIALVLPWLVACAGGDGGAGGARSGEAPALRACAVLSKVDARAILGAPTDRPRIVVEMAHGRQAVSRCVISSTDGVRNLSLLIRYSADETMPATREEVLERERAADTTAVGEESARALAAAQEVAGLGDLALFYELSSHHLAVFWERHYTMIVSITIDDGAAALRHARLIAERVLARY